MCMYIYIIIIIQCRFKKQRASRAQRRAKATQPMSDLRELLPLLDDALVDSSLMTDPDIVSAVIAVQKAITDQKV